MTDSLGLGGGTAFNAGSGGGTSNDTQLYLTWLDYQKDPQLQQFVRDNYSNYAWMLDNPELAPILVATAANGWGADQVASELTKTTWWKSNGQNVANWEQLQATDPATAAQRVTDMKATILADANTLGVGLNDSQMTTLATQANQFAWDSTTIQRNVANMVTQGANGGYNFAPTGTAAQFKNQMTSMLQSYAVPVSQATQDWWTSLAVQGKGDINGVEDYLRQQASQLYPWMASSIAKGIKPTDYLSPYSSIASNLLGTSASAIDWTDPKWQSALLAQQKDGSSLPVSTQQFAVNLRTNPTFGYSQTPTAISNAYSMAQQIETAFGKIKT